MADLDPVAGVGESGSQKARAISEAQIRVAVLDDVIAEADRMMARYGDLPRVGLRELVKELRRWQAEAERDV